ncbi:hypothetical protein TNCV_653971 [Trichonephila clavipes]|nr:hypothetical protein TNCV_653971 [Trichonephila clavipes]
MDSNLERRFSTENIALMNPQEFFKKFNEENDPCIKARELHSIVKSFSSHTERKRVEEESIFFQLISEIPELFEELVCNYDIDHKNRAEKATRLGVFIVPGFSFGIFNETKSTYEIPYWRSWQDCKRFHRGSRITIVRGEMAFLGKGSKVDLQYMATEMGVEDVLGMRVFELRDAILNSEYFDEEFCREFLNTIIEERKGKLAERKRKEEMEIAEGKRRADFEQKMRDMEMEFETQKKLIELEGEGHLAIACLDIEVSTDRGNIGKRSEIQP